MGGYGSGYRYLIAVNQFTLDDCRFLDINLMRQLGAVEEGVSKFGVWKWCDFKTNEVVSSIRYELNTIDESSSYIRFIYKFKKSGQSIDCLVNLLRTYPSYGGVRFWFKCPKMQKRVSKLFLLPDSNGLFLSRYASKLYYASQLRGKMDRAFDRKWKLMDKIDENIYPLRPKGMHMKTFKDINKKLIAHEKKCQRMIEEVLNL